MVERLTRSAAYVRGFGDAAQRQATNRVRRFGESVRNIIDAHQGIFNLNISDASQKPEPDFLCACNGKACDGICRAKSGHFRHAGSVGLEAKDGGCTAAYRPPKPKAARRPRR